MASRVAISICIVVSQQSLSLSLKASHPYKNMQAVIYLKQLKRSVNDLYYLNRTFYRKLIKIKLVMSNYMLYTIT